MSTKTKPKKSTKKLPATFRGATVVRGEGMNADALDSFLERNAMDQFDATKEMWLVIEDRALDDPDDSVSVRGFATREEALQCAKAQANGNVDHRVLCVTQQVLVVATMNNL
jgi:hypothetical protein